MPALREKIAFAQDKSYATMQGVSSRLLFLLAADAQIVRGRPLGAWTSTLYGVVEGQIVGGWAQHKDGGEIAVGLLEDVGADASAAIAAEAARLRAWLGDLRVTPRFRTPLERELAS